MALSTGVYRIFQWGQQQLLTVENGHVTVLPPGSVPQRGQEWRVEIREDGTVSIQNPANLFPSSSLSYQGEAEEGKRIVSGPLSDFPTREWRIERAPQRPLPVPYFIRVPDKDLAVVVSPLHIFPPVLALGSAGNGLQNAWSFELIRP